MKVCKEYQIPHSVFLNEWDEEDRAKAMAYMIHEASTCSRCGTQPWEWDPDQGGSKFAYWPRESICRGCELKDWIQKDKSRNTDQPGRYVELVPHHASD